MLDETVLNQARVAWANEKHQESLRLFDEFLSKNPTHYHGLIDSARVRGQQFDHSYVDEKLAVLLKTYPESIDLYLQIGMTYRMNYRPKLAADYFEKVVNMERNHSVALLELGILYERIGNLKRAKKMIDRCLKSSVNLPEAFIVKARILVREKRFNLAQSILKKVSLMKEGKVALETRVTALTEFARLLDKQGDHELAYKTNLSAKKLLQPTAKPLLSNQQKEDTGIRDFFQSIEQAHLQRWQTDEMVQREQTLCLMTSFPRSGTTLLEKMLGNHPDVIASDEMDVFYKRLLRPMIKACGGVPKTGPDAFDTLNPKLLNGLQNTYINCQQSVLGQPLSNKLLLDKNPNTTVFIPFFLRIFPQIKLLIPLRDPRDVILSGFFQNFPINRFSIHLLDLESAAKRYVHDMEHWITIRSKLDAHQWHEVSYEELTENPEQQLRSMLDFLSLPWDASTLDFHKGGTIIHNAPTYADVSSEIHHEAKQRWKKHESHFDVIRPILEPTMNALGYTW